MEDFERIKELGRGSFGAAILVRRKSDQKKLVVKGEVEIWNLEKLETFNGIVGLDIFFYRRRI